jgi:hypothetical protein
VADPPSWWAPLLSLIAQRDAENLEAAEAMVYSRIVAPGEWWPASPPADARTVVRREPDGSTTRRLVLP